MHQKRKLEKTHIPHIEPPRLLRKDLRYFLVRFATIPNDQETRHGGSKIAHPELGILANHMLGERLVTIITPPDAPSDYFIALTLELSRTSLELEHEPFYPSSAL